MRKALVTGATGFLGRSLIARLDSPRILSRNPDRARSLGDVEAFGWDAISGEPPLEAFQDVDVLFHLAGDGISDGRWTAGKKRRIRESRVEGTRRLVSTLGRLERPPRVMVAASATGFYGDRGDQISDESTRAGRGFLSELCVDWEREAGKAEAVGIRVVSARIGLVLGREGGAIARMAPAFRLGLGARLGDGKQWMPWVHVEDLVGLLLFAAENDSLRGPMNAVSPNPVRNKEFTQAMATSLRRPAPFAAPGFALRWMLGEFGGVLLSSERAVPEIATQAGYRFAYPQLDEALRAIFQPNRR